MAAQLGDDIVQGHIAENMTFEYDVPEQCYVTGHESLLTNALLNLAYNAAQHSGGTKMSLCWLRQENGKHVFMFADNGNGVEGEHLNRLFDMFYRIDSGRSRKTEVRASVCHWFTGLLRQWEGKSRLGMLIPGA